MNYRRGFQRIYAVLTAGWISALLFALPADRLKFWGQPPTGLTHIDYGLHSVAQFEGKVPTEAATVKPPVTEDIFDKVAKQDAACERLRTEVACKDTRYKLNPDHTITDIWVRVPEPSLQIVESAPDPVPSRLQKTLWLAGVAFGPPVLGYAAIFLVIPWIYRGFRPAKSP